MHILIAILLSLSLAACAGTMTTDPTMPPEPATPSKIQPVLDALDQLSKNKLLTLANKDARDTLAWVASADGPKDPMMIAKASACPNAILLATDNLGKQIGVLSGILRMKTAEISNGPPELVLKLTKLRYGAAGAPGSDLKGLYVMIRHDVFERVTFVTDSCREIVPAKEINHVLELAGQAGLIAGTGGIGGLVGPLAGLLP